MRSKARLFGHSIHQMLVVFPLGLLATSFIFDIIFLVSGNARFADISFWMIASGVVGGVAAAVFGLIDWDAIPSGTRAKRIGAVHGLGNVGVLGLFGVSWALRYEWLIPSNAAMVLSAVGVVLALVTGWLGGELVERLGIGVDKDAHADAPSSLTDRPAGEHVAGWR